MSASVTGPVLLRVGSWELVLADLASGEKLYVNRTTGEVLEEDDPPDAVLESFTAANAVRRRPVYEATTFEFEPLGTTGAVCQCCGDTGAVAGYSACPRCADSTHADVCSCCGNTGVVAGYGACPLCDGLGAAGWHFDEGQEPLEYVDLSEHCRGPAFLLRGFLTLTECCSIIRQAESFGLRDTGYSKNVRINDRVSVMGPDLAAHLFERARPFLADIEVRQMGGRTFPLGIRDDAKLGLWVPVGLNPCFRVCRYDPGGYFRPHVDGGFEYDTEHLSLKTFMMYLNDEFDGGHTSFFNNTQRHYEAPDSSSVIFRLAPERGSCLVFNHKLTHDGGVLASGVKYILRTEVMYRWQRKADLM